MKTLARALLLLGALAASQPALAISSTIRTTLGYCQLSITTAALLSTCSGGIPAYATEAVVTNEGAAYRWRDDGTAPTTSVGMPVATGTATAPITVTFFGSLPQLQFIAQTGTTVLDITFYK